MASHPVNNVSWFGAAAYCNWLSESWGLTPCYYDNMEQPNWNADLSRNGFHLPTEAQWERAAGCDDALGHLRYSMVGEPICQNINFFDADAWEYCNPLLLASEPYTTPVGYYAGAASPVGCHDVCGNVSEWCHDWYDAAYYTKSPEINPEGAVTGAYRVGRGGTYYSMSHTIRTEDRGFCQPWGAGNGNGFRIALQ